MRTLFNTVFSWSATRVLRKQIMLVCIALLIGIMAIGASAAETGEMLHEMIEWVGILLIFICVFGRTACTLYIGGRKATALTEIGPYSVTRNPLYVFSVIGAIGVGAQFGSVMLAIAAGALAWLIMHVFLVRKEEAALLERFGKPYAEYCRRVPRYWPDFSLWHEPASIVVSVPRVARTFLDASLFLLAVPLAECFEQLQRLGLIPVLFHLP